MTSPVRAHPMFDPPRIEWLTGIYRKRMTFLMICAHPDWFRAGDLDWLARNYPIWEAFEREADRAWDKGKRHYSARTIGEYLRHESALREEDDEHGFKVNDHAWPSLARLYTLMHPDRLGFFERRSGQSAVRAI